MYYILPVAAAASAPSSFTSMKALCITLETLSGSAELSNPEKSALSENIELIPIWNVQKEVQA